MHRTTIVIGIYLVVIGLILTAIGYFTHAPKTVVWDNGLQVSQQVETSKKVADFSKINVSGQDGNVKIVSGYHYNVKISGDKRQVPQYTVKKNTLYINKQQQAKVGFFGKQTITITVPTSQKISKLTANVGNGDLDLTNVKIDQMSINELASDDSDSINLDSVEVARSANINLSRSVLHVKDSTLNDLDLESGLANNDSTTEDEIKNETASLRNFTINNSRLNNSQIELHSNNLDIRKSVLNQFSAKSDYGRVKVAKSNLLATNSFEINRGDFNGQDLKVDGLDLSNKRGSIEYFGHRASQNNYRYNADANDLLRVSGQNLRIRIK